MENIPGISAIKKTDKINYFQFTFQGSKNTANKKITRQNILSKKSCKIKKKHIGSDTILLNQAIYSNFISRFFLKKCTNLRKQRDKTFCRSFRRR